MSTLSSSLTSQQQEAYAKMGENMFNSIDFETGKPKGQDPLEAVAYIESGLKSGLHVSFLEDNEKQILFDTFGEKWYERYGYTADDVLNCSHCKRGYSLLSAGEKLARCAGCRNVWYCSVEHQRADWKEHKKVCHRSSASAAVSSAPAMPDKTITLRM